MVMQVATFVHASGDYGSLPSMERVSVLAYIRKLKNFNFFGASDAG